MTTHVWLPNLGVWAASNDLSSEQGVMRDAEQSFTTRAEHSNVASCSSSPQSGRRNRLLVNDRLSSLVPRHRGDCSRQSQSYGCAIDDELHQNCLKTLEDMHPTCPICLSAIPPSDLAVLHWCMHRFCLTCIEKWSAIQRSCPLCKQTFRGWYYNIRSPEVFDENSFVRSSRERRVQGKRGRYLFSRRQIFPLGQTPRTTHDNLRRVAESEGEQAIRWRASIYARNLRAVPLILRSRVKINQPPPSDPGRKARIERRLEPWIHRELQAIAGDLDHSLLIHLVLALWLRYISEKEQVCTEVFSGRQLCGRKSRAEFGDAEASRQLEPFLQEKATLFWHELKCFAGSPYSLRAYDSVIKYKKR